MLNFLFESLFSSENAYAHTSSFLDFSPTDSSSRPADTAFAQSVLAGDGFDNARHMAPGEIAEKFDAPRFDRAALFAHSEFSFPFGDHPFSQYRHLVDAGPSHTSLQMTVPDSGSNADLFGG